MTKIVMEDGIVLYSEQNLLAFKAYVNAANSKGAATFLVYKDKLMTEGIEINLNKVLYFEDSSRTSPIPTITSVHQSFEGSVGTTALSFDPSSFMSHILFISNDGTTDLFLTFDDEPVTTTPPTNSTSEDGVIRLKAGEVLTDMRLSFQKINMIRSSGTGTVRVVAT